MPSVDGIGCAVAGSGSLLHLAKFARCLDLFFILGKSQDRTVSCDSTARSASEARILLDIETERAKQRQGSRTDLLVNIPPIAAECNTGESRIKVAAQLGIGKQGRRLASTSADQSAEVEPPRDQRAQ